MRCPGCWRASPVSFRSEHFTSQTPLSPSALSSLQVAVTAYFFSMFGLTVYLISDSVISSLASNQLSGFHSLQSPGCQFCEGEATESLPNSGHQAVAGISNYHHLLSGFLQQDEVLGGLELSRNIINFSNNLDWLPLDWMTRRTILPTI